MEYVPKLWIENYSKYAIEWDCQPQYSIDHPPIPLGPNIVKSKDPNSPFDIKLVPKEIMIQNARTKLTYQQYLKINSKNFSLLSDAEKKRKYQEYVARKEMNTQIVSRPQQQPTRVKPRGLSKCSQLYSLALISPWNCPEPPCVPDNITIPSYKFQARARTNFVVGSGGCGFVMLDPYLFGTSEASVKITSNAYSSNAYDLSDIGLLTVSSDSPYPLNQFQPFATQGLSLRVVGCAVKVRYTGAEITRAGQAVCVRNSENGAWGGILGSSAFLADRESISRPVDREWSYAMWKPASPRDLAYWPTSASDYDEFSILEPSLGVVVFGSAENSNFEVDVCAWYELIGNSGLPNLTASHSDPLGISVVSASLSKQQPTGTPLQEVKRFITSATSAVNDAFSFIQPVVELGSTIYNTVKTAEPLLALML
jgi:hypothetical protein